MGLGHARGKSFGTESPCPELGMPALSPHGLEPEPLLGAPCSRAEPSSSCKRLVPSPQEASLVSGPGFSPHISCPLVFVCPESCPRGLPGGSAWWEGALFLSPGPDAARGTEGLERRVRWGRGSRPGAVSPVREPRADPFPAAQPLSQKGPGWTPTAHGTSLCGSLPSPKAHHPLHVTQGPRSPASSRGWNRRQRRLHGVWAMQQMLASSAHH